MYSGRTAILVLIFAVLLNAATVLGKVPEPGCYAKAECWYIYLTGDALTMYSGEDDLSPYDGVSFPHYFGYVIFDEKGLIFKKKTSLPFIDATKLFEDIFKNGYVMTRANIHLRHLIKPVYPGEPGWAMALFDAIVSFPGLHWITFTGPPDENYEPVFTETCVFNLDKKQFCQWFTMEGSVFTRLVPTSNTVRERRIRRGDSYEYYVERYNDETGKWEYSHEAGLDDAIIHSWH